MKIRSITYFCNPEWPISEKIIIGAGDFIRKAKPAFETHGFEVQTVRLATSPFPEIVLNCEENQVLDFAQELELKVKQQSYDYLSLGPALPQKPNSYRIIPNILKNTQNVFLSGLLGNPGIGIDLQAVYACANVISDIATISPEGFANLRFAALANVPPGAPFFPAAYHTLADQGEQPVTAFALATEAADLAMEAFTHAINLDDAQNRLLGMIEHHATNLTTIAETISEATGDLFMGIDFTLAPYPNEHRSIGTAMERMGVPAVGLHGSLAATAILTDIIDQAQFRRTGFNGVMLPLLEDATLAASAVNGLLSLTDLLLYSTVCGTGLDTIPLPGDISADEIAAILLDLAVLATRLDKPLTARLMPIPGKLAGDMTSFDFEYFANSRVLSAKVKVLHGFLTGDSVIKLKGRC
jgi:uncharacterized protein (UPF0210 family)